MAIRNIFTDEDPVLRGKCREVEEITPRIIELLDDMADTLHKAEGVGLAAPQVGVKKRICIVETEPGNLIEFINPVIIEKSGEQEGLEGCLSIPGKWGITKRPMKVTVRATGRDGKEFTITGEELTAKAFCHEIDHLDGILYTDNVIRMVDPSELEEDEDE